MLNSIKLKIKNNFLELYFQLILVLVIFLLIFNSYNFVIDIFGDRDLIRSQNLFNSFQVYGADFGMQNGKRIPGGFNYYYLKLFLFFTDNILIINFSLLIISILSIFYLILNHFKWFNRTGVLFSLLFFLTSGVFTYQSNIFWNPTLGLPFAILSLSFFYSFIFENKKFSKLFLSFFLIFLASQLHLSYLVYLLPYIFLLLLYNSKNILRIFLIILSSILLSYSAFIINFFYPLINKDLNDFFLISQSINNELYFNVIRGFYSKVINIIPIKLFIILSMVFFLFFLSFYKYKKIINNYLSEKKYFLQEFLVLFLVIVLLNYKKITPNQIIFFSLTIPIFIFSNYLILKDKFGSLTIFDSYKKIIFFTYFILFFIIIISSTGYVLAYGSFNLIVGESNRYSLSLIPIYSILMGYGVSTILTYSSKSINLNKIIKIVLLLTITFKFFLFSNFIYENINNKFHYNYNNKSKIIRTLSEKYEFNKNDFYTKVSFALIKENTITRLSKPSFQHYVESKIKNIKQSNFNDCILIVVNSFKDSDLELTNKSLLKKKIRSTNYFGYPIKLIKILKFDKFFIVEYKPLNGDCEKGVLNDYIISKNEKKAAKYLMNKKSNIFFKEISEKSESFYIKINSEDMLFPINLLFDFEYLNDNLIVNLSSKRLRNSDTFLNGYWDSTVFLNPKLILTNKLSKKNYSFDLIQGKLGKGNLKTPWQIVLTGLPFGNYEINFYVDKLSEKFSNIELNKLNFKMDNNYKYR